MQPECLRTVYLLGSAETGHLGHVSLGADGKVKGDDDPKRARFGFQGAHAERFYFLNATGEKQARLRYCAPANAFFPDDYSGLYLVPLLTLEPPREAVGSARLLVNTIPKSGTYLLDLVLTEIGYHGLGLHLIPHECHDNRGQNPDTMHRDPFSRRIFAPAAAVARAMAAGEFALGHVGDEVQIKQVSESGVGVINCRRNLRDVVASLFHFKRKSVDPQAPSDHLWRRLEGGDGFLGFLCAYGETELADIAKFATMMPALPGVSLRFEELAQGRIPEQQREELDQLDYGLGLMIAECLPACLGRQSSTLSSRRADWRKLWSPAAEEFFDRSGLLEANRGLGYEIG